VIAVPPVLTDPTKNAVSALNSHITAETKKFSGRDTKNTVGQVLIHNLTSQAIAISPFTLDPLGGLGPFATSLLFRSLPTPPAPTLSVTAKAAHTLSSGGPAKVSAILAKADSKWHSLYTTHLFGKAFRTPTPSSWAKQLLGLNFILATSKHFHTSMLKHNKLAIQSLTPPPTIPGQHATYYFSTVHHHAPPSTSLLHSLHL
jgi:hypothetical protein